MDTHLKSLHSHLMNVVLDALRDGIRNLAGEPRDAHSTGERLHHRKTMGDETI